MKLANKLALSTLVTFGGLLQAYVIWGLISLAPSELLMVAGLAATTLTIGGMAYLYKSIWTPG
jgi:hypothetical protein